MAHSTSIDLMKVPGDPWGRREYLLSEALPGVLARSTDYIHNRYKSREQLESSCRFAENYLLDAVSGNIEFRIRVGFFPWREAQHELSIALDQALMGFYRAAYDHQRRALELILVGAWFVSGQTSPEKARKRINSRERTPPFSKTLDSLSKENLYVELKAKTDWVCDVKKFYHHLCDIIHVRGTPNGIYAFRSGMFNFSGSIVPEFSEETLGKVLDSYVETIGYTALLMAMSYPVVLFGMPVEKKYGMNGPSGFLEEGQAEHLRTLIPEKYRDSLIALAEEDPRVTGARDDCYGRPDLTDQEWQAQIEDFNNTMKNLSE